MPRPSSDPSDHGVLEEVSLNLQEHPDLFWSVSLFASAVAPPTKRLVVAFPLPPLAVTMPLPPVIGASAFVVVMTAPPSAVLPPVAAPPLEEVTFPWELPPVLSSTPPVEAAEPPLPIIDAPPPLRVPVLAVVPPK